MIELTEREKCRARHVWTTDSSGLEPTVDSPVEQIRAEEHKPLHNVDGSEGETDVHEVEVDPVGTVDLESRERRDEC
jgi:hypothetical protein